MDRGAQSTHHCSGFGLKTTAFELDLDGRGCSVVPEVAKCARNVLRVQMTEYSPVLVVPVVDVVDLVHSVPDCGQSDGLWVRFPSKSSSHSPSPIIVQHLASLLPQLSDLFLEIRLLAGDLLASRSLLVKVRLVDLNLAKMVIIVQTW